MSTLRIAVVEDDAVTRHALASLLSAVEGFELTGAVATLREARAQLRELRPDVLLLDLQLPDGNGLDLLALVRAQPHVAKVLVLSVFGDVQSVVRAIEQGVDGYLLKDADVAGVSDAIRTVARGGAPLSPAIAGHILERVRTQARQGRPSAAARPVALTDRETLVLTQLARGFSYKEIAELERISPHTVADHAKAIYRKLAVNSRSEAVFEAVQSGLIRLPGAEA
jgi:DNA-binding NarL/FixJ family response regulator